MVVNVEDLRKVSFFANFSKGALAHVASVATRRTYLANKSILVEGSPCQGAYIIAEGKVRIYRVSADGREQVLSRLGPGETFNIVSCIKSRSFNPATAEALTPVTLYVIASNDFTWLIRNCHDLALAIIYDVSDRLERLTYLVENLSLHTVRGRLARFLLDHADRDGKIMWTCTQVDIANRLGTVRDVIGRIMRDFTDLGFIDMPGRHCIVIRDLDGLEAESRH